MKIYIIDSDTSFFSSLKSLIDRNKFEYKTIHSVEMLLSEDVAAFAPEIVLIDPVLLVNTKKNIYARTYAVLKRFPVIFIVKSDFQDITDDLRALNVYGWITKPVNPVLFDATLDLAIARLAIEKQSTAWLTRCPKIIECIQDVCWITNLEGIIEDISPSTEYCFNFKREEMLGKKITDFTSGATDDGNLWSTIKTQGFIQNYQIEVINKDEKKLNCLLTAELMPQLQKIFGIFKNIRGGLDTQRQLSRILEGAAVPIFVLNAQHVVTHWNKAIENLTGVPAGEIVGKKGVWRAFYPEERPVLADLILDGADKAEFAKYYAQGIRQSFLIPGAFESEQYFESIGNRKKIWLSFSAAQIRNESGQVTGVIETLHDISESVRIDKALKESELKFRTFFDQSSDGLVLINQRGKIIEWNKAQETITQYKRHEMIGMKMTDIVQLQSRISWVKTNLLEHIFEVVEYFLNNRETIINNRVIEGEIVQKDGQRKYFQSTIFPIHLNESTLVAIIVHDMTQYKQMEAIRQNVEEQLRQQKRLESIGTLASGVAHEVNNPLTGIINYAQLIYDRIDDTTLQEFAQGIIEEGERVAGIVRNLLAFARQDKEGHSSARMSDIIRVSLALIETVIRKDMITIKVDVPDDLPMVHCKSQQIEQVIINLLMNARDALNMKYDDYSEEKIIEVKAYANRQIDKYWLTTEVTDYGIGIPAEIVTSIFDPFFTTKSRSEGTGLGLSVSYGIIKEHGGEIKVESVEGKYTKFSFNLPVDDITVS